MASKKKRNNGHFAPFKIWRDCRKAQTAIINKAVDAACQTPEYQELEIEKRVAFGVMAFTVSFMFIAISVVALIVSFWRG